MSTPFDAMGAAFAEGLGRPLTITIGGVPREVRAVFRRRQPADIVADDGMAVAGPAVTLAVPTASVPGVAEGDRVEVDAVAYLVAGAPEHDGRGMTRLTLQRA